MKKLTLLIAALLSFGILAPTYAEEVVVTPDIQAENGNIVSCGIHVRLLNDDYEYFEGTIAMGMAFKRSDAVIYVDLFSGKVDRITHKLSQNKPKNSYIQTGDLDSRDHIKELDSTQNGLTPDEFLGVVPESDKTLSLWLPSILKYGMTVGYDSPVHGHTDIIFNLAPSEIPQKVNPVIIDCLSRLLNQHKAETENKSEN